MAQAGDLGAELNLLCRHGHTVGPFDLEWLDEAGNPVNLTGAVFTSVIYDNKETQTLLDTFDITVVSMALGTFTVVLPAVRSAALPEPAKLFYLVSATLAGIKLPLFYGTLEVRVA